MTIGVAALASHSWPAGQRKRCSMRVGRPKGRAMQSFDCTRAQTALVRSVTDAPGIALSGSRISNRSLGRDEVLCIEVLRIERRCSERLLLLNVDIAAVG